MKVGDLVEWYGSVGVVVGIHKYQHVGIHCTVDKVKILWANGSPPSWRWENDTGLEVINESR